MLSFGKKTKTRSSLSHNNTLTNAKKINITYSSDRSSFLDELLLLFWGKSSFYSACLLPETNSNVSREERSGFVYVGRLHEHAAHVVIYIWTLGGGIALEIMS